MDTNSQFALKASDSLARVRDYFYVDKWNHDPMNAAPPRVSIRRRIAMAYR